MTTHEDSQAFEGSAAPIRVFLAPEVTRIDPAASLKEVADQLVSNEIGALVVGTGEKVEGILSERDVVRALSRDGAASTATAGELASRKLVWCNAEDTVGDVAEVMMQHYVRHVLVGHPGHLQGIVSSRDLLGALLS